MWWKFRKDKTESEDLKPWETEKAGGRSSPKGAASYSAKATAGSSARADSVDLRTGGQAPLTKVSKAVKHVEVVTKKKTSTLLSGEYKSRFKGQGMQFSDSRVYQYGDDIRHMDWRTSARMTETYVKTFEEERELHLLFVVDASASAQFGSTGQSKREAMATALACMGFSAISNNDRVGLLFFSDRVERFVPAKKGRKHVLRLIDELLTFKATSGRTDINAALNFLSSTLKNGAVIILASDFFAGFDKRKLEYLSKKHDFICLRTTDPRDTELPNVGLIRVEDPETGEVAVLQTNSAKARRDYASSQVAYRNAVAQVMRKAGASLVDLATDADAARVLHQFFHSRKGGRP
jgi:uncharacterized protein (DUF58 family)